MVRLKIGLAFVAGVAVGVVVCLGLYVISTSHLLPRQSRGAPGDEHAEPLEFEHNGNAQDVVPGATLSLLPLTFQDQPDEQSIKHFSLHIPIKAPPGANIDPRELVVHVLFYDLVDGQTVVQTSANVNSRWMTPPANWVKSETEELAVEYQLPKPDAGATKRGRRAYYGYLVRVYYRQRLQAATADPVRLRQQYPPPPTLPK